MNYVFLGADRTGKSSTMLALAKILANVDKKVLVIDATQSQGVYSFFDYNFDIEVKNPLDEGKTIVRENFEIVFSNMESEFEFEKLNKYNFSKYDYVFIEGDKNLPPHLVNTAHIILFQDFDKHTLLKNKIILKKFKIDANKLTVIFNNMLDDVKLKDHFLDELFSEIKLNISGLNEIFEIPFEEVDIVNTIENKTDGYLDLKAYSNCYKSAIYEIVNSIEEIDKKTFKKILGK